MQQPIILIARFAVLEALRTRLAVLVAAVLAFMWMGSAFIHQVAITESDRLQWSFFAAGARLASVFMLALYITSSMVREFNEKGPELVLALDLPRASYLIGKLIGFIAIGAAIALAAGLPLAFATPAHVAAVWTASLAFELAIVSAASLFCVVTFSQVLPAVTLIIAFYLLARMMTAIRLMAETALPSAMEGAGGLIDFAVAALSYLVPALDKFTMTQWIAARTVEADVLIPIAIQSVVYVALLLGASLFDFYRREL